MATPGRAALAGLAVGAIAMVAIAILAGGGVGRVVVDPDDAMRLVMVRDWLAGQPWGDVWQHRMQPGGTPMHWSRLDDLPVAAVIVSLRWLVGQAVAERVAMVAWPIVLVPVLFATSAAASAGSWRRVGIALAATSSGALLYRFMPGRIDHHALMTTTANLAAATLLLRPSARNGAVAGAATAACLAVGFEDIAILAILGSCAAGAWAWTGARDYAVGYGAALAVGAALAWAVLVPDGARLATACDSLSGAWAPALATCGAGLSVAALAMSARGRYARGAALVATALAAAPWLVFGAGSCLAGPFTGLSPAVRDYWLSRVGEMTDVLAYSNGRLDILVSTLLVPLMAIGLAWYANERKRPVTLREGAYFLVLFASTLVGARYVRNSGLPVALAAPLVARALDGPFASGAIPPRIRTFLAVLAALPMALLGEDLALAAPPSTGDRSAECNMHDNWAMAASLPPGVAMTPLDLGAMTLLETRLSVVSGGYHRATKGLADVVSFMEGDEANAARVLREDGVSYVLWCSRMREVTLAPGSHPGGMGARLAEERLPSWLVPLPGQAGPIEVARVDAVAMPR